MTKSDALRGYNRRQTPQSEQADPRQVRNSAGGFTFTLDPLAQVERFLILGTDSGTYYSTPQALTRENAKVIEAVAATQQHKALVDLIVKISIEGRAPKVNPVIFALALTCSVGTVEQRAYALNQISKVCRTGTHIFTFATYVESMRGWGRALRTGVAEWYTERSVDSLAYQMVKYRQRDGWTHRDLLRLAHPVTEDEARKALFEWAVRGVGFDAHPLPSIVQGYERAKSEEHIAPLIAEFGLPWEALPTEALNDRAVWEALQDTGSLPLGALTRQLPRLTNLGLFAASGDRRFRNAVIERLHDVEEIRRARMHPVSLLIAQKTYAQGHSMMGKGTWSPSREVIKALDDAFYLAFKAAEPTGKRILLALDVSGSMSARVANTPLSAREGAAAMALATVAIEDQVDVVGYTSDNRSLGWRSGTALVDLNGRVDPSRRLDDVVRSISNLPFGATDCAVPFVWAKQAGKQYDAVVSYTDNETWAGPIHVHEALRQYREASGIDTKFVAVGMTATSYTVGDPADVGSLNCVGFDSAVPNLITEFIR